MRLKQRELNVPSFHHNPLMDVIYRGRGVSSFADINYSLSGMLPPVMKGMEEACSLIEKAILNNDNILIIGDYDCDGATATSIAVAGLLSLGAKNIGYLVPDRMTLGYGLTPAIVDLAAAHNPELIITVDNGISAVAGAEQVKRLVSVKTGKAGDVKLLITDHHLAPDVLPDADAIVNPNQKDCPFPSKCIAGCGVMFYLLLYVRTHFEKHGLFKTLGIDKPDIRELLDLLALGTVADVVALDKNNRILVYQGLKRIREGLVRPGIKYLFEVGGGNLSKITATDFGFGIGPRINSVGRLDDMTYGISCLLELDDAEARSKAEFLNDLNDQRKEIQSDMTETANSLLKAMNFTAEDNAMSICVHNESFHEGVIGLVASRLKEDYSRPVIVFTDTEAHPDEIKGSGRSIPEIHLRDVLEEVSLKTGCITKFGGHAMAAGLSIKKESLELFKKVFEECVSSKISKIDGVIETDGDLPPHLISIETCQMINDAGPWGQMFPEPVFSGQFLVNESRALKSKHLKMTLTPIGTFGNTIDAIFFNYYDGKKREVNAGDRVNIAFSLSINTFRGNTNVQLMTRFLELI